MYGNDPASRANRLYNDAPKKMFAKRTNWNLETNRLSAALAAHRAAGKPLIDLTGSNPTECGFRYDEEAILSALQNPASLKYEPNPHGLEVARSAVVQYYAHRGPVVSNGDIFLTTSTSEAYSYSLRTLCNPDDEVLIPGTKHSGPSHDVLIAVSISQASGSSKARMMTVWDAPLIELAPSLRGAARRCNPEVSEREWIASLQS